MRAVRRERLRTGSASTTGTFLQSSTVLAQLRGATGSGVIHRARLLVGNLNGLLGALTDTEREMISVERMDEYCSSRRGRENASQEGMDTEASNEPEGAGDEEDSGLQDCG